MFPGLILDLKSSVINGRVCSGGAARLDDAPARSERRTHPGEDEEEPVSDRRRQPDAGGEEEEDPEEPAEAGGRRRPLPPRHTRADAAAHR